MEIVKKIFADDLLRASSIMFFATILTGGINLVYHLFMGRALGKATYSEFSALYALGFFLSFILIKTIRISQTQSISRLKSKNNLKIMPKYYNKICSHMILYGFAAFFIFSICSGYIASFLHLDSIFLVLIIGVFFLFSFILPVNLGTMQGLQRFHKLALTNMIRVGARFIIGVGLVLSFNHFALEKFGIYGALIGLAAGIIIALIFSFYFIRDSIRLPSLNFFSHSKPIIPQSSTSTSDLHDYSSQDKEIEFKDQYKFSFFILLAVIGLTIPTNIDVILIKHFFTEDNAGLYAAASIFGRMIFFLPIGITTVMYPKVVEAHTKKRDTKSILKRSLIYTSIPTGLLVLVFFLFPKFFLGLLYGEEYLEAGPFIKLYGLYIFFFSLTAVLVYYNLAKNRHGVIYFFSAFSILELGFIYVFHSSIIAILQLLLILNIILFIATCVISYYFSIKDS